MTTDTAAPVDAFRSLLASWPAPNLLKSWTPPVAGDPMASCRQALGFAAGALENQATYLRQLSQCTDPAEAMKLHSDFIQKAAQLFWRDGAEALSRAGYPQAPAAAGR
ncbi:phasin family protein [Xanthobacter sp. ZOL 2024]